MRPKAARANAHDGTRSRRGAIATAPAKHAIVSGSSGSASGPQCPTNGTSTAIVAAATAAAAQGRRR